MLTVPSKPQAFEPFLDSPSDATSSSSYIVEPSVSPTSPLTNTGVVYEQDAGYIEMVEPQRVPPGYNPQWAVDRECRLEFLSPTTPTFPPTPTSPSPFSPSRTASEIELGLKQRTVGE
jgi:hypothetical protein